MAQNFKTIDIALKALVLHPRNVRNTLDASPESIAPLAANILTCGLLQPLLVQALEDGAYGVLAGGRRLAALQMLAADAEAKAYKAGTKIPCRLVPETVEITTALSLAENEMQLPMDAVDRFEAFAAMHKSDGMDVAAIAHTFGIRERVVRETMRLGNIHPDVRQAYRDRRINLETLEAFQGHPDPAIQLETYQRIEKEHGSVQRYRVDQALNSAFIRIGSPLGSFVAEGYEAAKGPIEPDLIEEDSILSDPALIESVLAQKLDDLAEAERERLGFAWGGYMIQPGYSAFADYDRVYPSEAELGEADQQKVEVLTLQLEDLEEEYDACADYSERVGIEQRSAAIDAEITELTHRFEASDLSRSGVMAIWEGNEVRFECGLVKPELTPASSRDADGDAGTVEGADGASVETAPAMDVAPKYSATLLEDMAFVRTRAVGLALAQSPEIARAFAEFQLVASLLADSPWAAQTHCSISLNDRGWRSGEAEGSHLLIEQSVQALHDELDLSWLATSNSLNADGAGDFARYRALDPEMRGRILAYVVAHSLDPICADKLRAGARQAVEDEVLPDIRAVWTPDESFLKRRTKPELLRIMSELGLSEEVKMMDGSKKSGVVAYLVGLFEAPFATLTQSQQAAVASWTPDIMQRERAECAPQDAAMYEVQHCTISDGWINTWSICHDDGRSEPQTFDSFEEAEAAIEEFFSDLDDAVADGERDADHGYARDTFRVVQIED